jgi:hypothetical protein
MKKETKFQLISIWNKIVSLQELMFQENKDIILYWPFKTLEFTSELNEEYTN